MAQFTIRTSEELLEQIRRTAKDEARSMNEYVTRVLEAAVNPDLADSDMQRVRERLARAGLLAEHRPSTTRRPDRDALARARAAAGQGTPLADMISHDRQ